MDVEQQQKAIVTLRDNGYMISDIGILASINMEDNSMTMEFIPWEKIRKISTVNGKPYIVIRLWVTDDDIFNVMLKNIEDVPGVYTLLVNSFLKSLSTRDKII